MARVYTLYRVSTVCQVDHDDIPMQRIACREFAQAQAGWEIVKELYEKGVSGYKVKTENSAITNPYDKVPDETDSVYIKVLKPGSGQTPLYTDSVSVYYRGSLINGEVFDQNFQGDLNTDIHTPTTFALQSSGYDGLVNGWVTALQYMKEGDYVMLYIPSDLGYGDSSQDAIPGHSVLIFEMLLEKVIHPKGIEDKSRAALRQENE